MKKRVKRQHGTSLHASGEDYLEAVLVLQKEKGMVRSVDVARHMGVSKPSVCHAVATLKEDSRTGCLPHGACDQPSQFSETDGVVPEKPSKYRADREWEAV